MVGKTMAMDLAADPEFEVTVADISRKNLDRVAASHTVKTLEMDLGNKRALARAVEPFDIIVGALPSGLGFAGLQTVIEAGKSISDISFMPEDALALDQLAKANGVTAVVDCGVSPGLSNLFVGHAYHHLDSSDAAVIYVGGLPKRRRWPFYYKAPFAPGDVIEEYTRPARFMERGELVIKPALTDAELIDFPHIGTLEAFNTDGLRSLLTTVKIPNMREKTLRYPGHIEIMRIFRETGLFRTDEIEVGDQKIRPRDITSRLLFKAWEFEPGEEEFTVLRVVVDGKLNGERRRYTYELFDEYCTESGLQSMARTTGFPNTIMARMIAKGTFRQPGVNPPELFGHRSDIFELLLQGLADRGINIHIDGP
jgi:saccharopine dehydrogenase-like NADP-dependent oxidoreductase